MSQNESLTAPGESLLMAHALLFAVRPESFEPGLFSRFRRVFGHPLSAGMGGNGAVCGWFKNR
jgi:hypothetical protein